MKHLEYITSYRSTLNIPKGESKNFRSILSNTTTMSKNWNSTRVSSTLVVKVAVQLFYQAFKVKFLTGPRKSASL